MITFAVLFILLLVAWWSFSWVLRNTLWKEEADQGGGVFQQLISILQHQLRTLSPQNAVAQGLVDFELKSRNLMQSLMIVALSRIGILPLLILLLCVRNLWAFTGAIALGSIILMVAFKRPTRWIQIALL